MDVRRMNYSRLVVSVLIWLFSLSSWIAINGIWVELPALVQEGVPEGYQLGAFLVVIIQLANIGPLTFTLINYLFKDNQKSEIIANYVILIFGTSACFLLIFLWDHYSVWNVDKGILHSTALIILTFCVALVDCTSSVTFAPFITSFKKVYITWYFIGESCSSVVPSLVALIQGAGRTRRVANFSYIINESSIVLNCTDWSHESVPLRFQPEGFFAFLAVAMGISLLSHLLLNLDFIVGNERNQIFQSTMRSSPEEERPLLDNPPQSDNQIQQPQRTGLPENQRVIINSKTSLELIYLFSIIAVLQCLSNGVLSGVASYSAGAYGLQSYSIVTALTSIISPIGAIMVYLRPHKSMVRVGLVAFTGLLFAAYCFYIAVTNENPPFQGKFIGKFLVVLSWLAGSGLFSYTIASIGWILRNEPNSRLLLRLQGGVTQIGSLIGAISIFVMVHYTTLFNPKHFTEQWTPVCEIVGNQENAFQDF